MTTRAYFLFASNLAVNAILGTGFIDPHVKGILPKERRVIFRYGETINLLGSSPRAEGDREATQGLSSRTTFNKVRVAKQAVLSPMSQVPVLVTTEARGVMFLQNHPRTVPKNLSLMANGSTDSKGLRFLVTASKFRDRPFRTPKRAVIGLALPAFKAVPTVQIPLVEGPVLDPSKEATLTDGVNIDERQGQGSRQVPCEEQLQISAKHETHRQDIVELLRDFKSMWSGRLGKILIAKHQIDLEEGTQPIYQPPYRAEHRVRAIEKAEIGRMREEGVIEPASAEWASPVVLVPRKDGTLRFCVDYRRLNALTRRDSYTIPRMDECIDSLGDTTIFSTLDCNSGYLQVEVDEADRDKTTLTSHLGILRFLRIPFGLKNAPANFHRAIDIILSRIR